MARLRLSNDILSPLNSDISLNDGSAFSFGSLPGTPVFESNFASPICTGSSKDIDIGLIHARNMKECINTFDEVTGSIRRQSSTNSDKEEKYKDTYEDLKKSMDDLFGKNSNSLTSTSPLKSRESKNENFVSKVHSKMNAVDKIYYSENPMFVKKNKHLKSENISEASENKSEKCKTDKTVANKQNKNQHQSKQTSSESVKGTKNRSDTNRKNDALTIEKKDTLVNHKKSFKLAPSENDTASCETKLASKILPEKKKEKGVEEIKDYQFKCQKKIPFSNTMPDIENKSLSIEKSIQLTVSMEMENIRRFVLNQNLCMQKDLLKLKEMAKKQNEVTDYLFSVIDELMDANNQLISKYN